MDKLLTLNEAAEFLKVDVETFQILVHKYNIPHYKIAGKFIRFSQNELEKYKLKIAEFKKGKARRIKVDIHKKAQAVEYKRKDLNWGLRLYEFLKFNDFYIISFIIVILLLYYIFKY